MKLEEMAMIDFKEDEQELLNKEYNSFMNYFDIIKNADGANNNSEKAYYNYDSSEILIETNNEQVNYSESILINEENLFKVPNTINGKA